MKVSLFWFRRDLRLNDNTALQAALNTNKGVIPLFIFDENILDELEVNDPRVNFIYNNLKAINKQLQVYGSSILCKKGKHIEVWKKLTTEYDIENVYINKDYEPYALERDNQVKQLLQSKGIKLLNFKDQVIFEENEIIKQDGSPYTVFTPYKNKWLSKFNGCIIKAAGSHTHFHQASYTFPSLEEIGFRPSQIKVKAYDLSIIDEYAAKRNYPALDACSYLSPHLRFGTLSIRQVISQLKPKHAAFLSELIWREFFMQILFHFPHVVHQNFRPKYNGIQWRNNESDFEKWCTGQTGYPMVDAGMRELNQTGYMHNRIRMITAGFLCKHLLIDWRWGEAYFAQKLLDYELSSNNGNWQWAAGTGCDAAPYFRIFNPIEQLKKFDKEEVYIKKWIPEYSTGKYPAQMIDHKLARQRALQTYKDGIKA